MLQKLFTVGYNTCNPEGLARLVCEHNAYLVDIRYYPTSPAPQWRRGVLQRQFGAAYIWCGALGNINYRKESAPIKLLDPETGTVLVERLLSTSNVILLCGCREVSSCHRLVAANLLLERNPGLVVEHLEGLRVKAEKLAEVTR